MSKSVKHPRVYELKPGEAWVYRDGCETAETMRNYCNAAGVFKDRRFSVTKHKHGLRIVRIGQDRYNGKPKPLPKPRKLHAILNTMTPGSSGYVKVNHEYLAETMKYFTHTLHWRFTVKHDEHGAKVTRIG